MTSRSTFLSGRKGALVNLRQQMRFVIPDPLRQRLRSFVRPIGRRFNVHIDSVTGLFYERCFSQRVFIRARRDHQPEHVYEWLCRDVYFSKYLPKGDDVVVDIGAGFGHEALYVHNHSPRVRYIGVEVQPIVYECLANTFAPYRPNLVACPYAISSRGPVSVNSLANYEEVATEAEGIIDVPTIDWADFVKRYALERIALLKVNIEGGERTLFDDIPLDSVDRVIVSAHDFRADLGHGEHFRTRDSVLLVLRRAGFRCSRLGEGGWWGDWIFADRPDDITIVTTPQL